MKTAFLVYPHQLFAGISRLRICDAVFLVEDPLFFSEFPFHKQKLVLHRASMKAYAAFLKDNGLEVRYIECADMNSAGDILSVLKRQGVESVEIYDLVDDWLFRRLKESSAHAGIKLTVHESPMFLTTVDDFTEFFKGRTGSRKYFMNDFYIWQRKRLGILIENGKPAGGAWSFDKDNRKKLPRGIEVPATFQKNTSPFVHEAISYVEKHFPNNFGDIEEFWCPVTHEQAEAHLQHFLKNRFAEFGPYEDAMSQDSPSVFHSTISPLLNNGLLTPGLVLEEMQKFLSAHDVPLSSVEGFVRQIIGWREYIRALYVLEGRNIRTKNYFKAKNPLPQSFWTGTTGIEPVDHHVSVLRKYAYTHHIPRLMVFGNFMNLCHIHPDQAYGWFMEMYIDAYDWVMVANVYSMALYADGGLLTTKPYISSSNYLLKMSDFKKGPWCDSLDSLFWNFVGMHFDKLQKEGRLGFIGVQYVKMPNGKKEAHQFRAESFLKGLYE